MGNAPLEWTETAFLWKAKTGIDVSAGTCLARYPEALLLICSWSKGHNKRSIAQTLGPWKRPVAYLSKRLDPVTAGWPMPGSHCHHGHTGKRAQ
jgi:hypothetical protein